MTFSILYKLTKKNQVQTWQIFVKGDEFWTEEGILGGVITKSLPTKCLPKNEGKKNATSGAEQAEKEAAAKFKKKLESSYFEDVEDARGGTKSFYEPMLAHNFSDYKNDIAYPVYSQPKLDGIRCITTKEGMFSRNGKKFISAPHIFEQLKPFFKQNPNAILDGELYCDKLNDNFNKICSLVKRTKPTPEELTESAQIIQYWIYDAPRIGIYTETEKFIDRYNVVRELLLNKYPSIKIVETKLISNYEQLTIVYEKYLEDGFEGQMIRLNKAYENKRSTSLLKRKDFIDEEYTIVAVFEGEGNRAGTAGYMTFYTRNGKPFKSNIKGSFPWLRQLWRDRESLKGKQATIKYFNLTPDSVPRFPYVIRIRDYE
jgi:DNA ligase 1